MQPNKIPHIIFSLKSLIFPFFEIPGNEIIFSSNFKNIFLIQFDNFISLILIYISKSNGNSFRLHNQMYFCIFSLSSFM